MIFFPGIYFQRNFRKCLLFEHAIHAFIHYTQSCAKQQFFGSTIISNYVYAGIFESKKKLVLNLNVSLYTTLN